MSEFILAFAGFLFLGVLYVLGFGKREEKRQDIPIEDNGKVNQKRKHMAWVIGIMSILYGIYFCVILLFPFSDFDDRSPFLIIGFFYIIGGWGILLERQWGRRLILWAPVGYVGLFVPYLFLTVLKADAGAWFPFWVGWLDIMMEIFYFHWVLLIIPLIIFYLFLNRLTIKSLFK